MVAGGAVQKLMMALENEQEILMNVSDMLSEVYTSESLLLRIQKLHGMGHDVTLLNDILHIHLHDAVIRLENAGKNALESFADGDELKMMLIGLKRYTKQEPFNCKNARRRLADKLIEENRYCF